MRKSKSVGRPRYIEVSKKGQRHMMLVMGDDSPRKVRMKKRPSNQWKENPSIVVEESSDQDDQGGYKREGGDYLYQDDGNAVVAGSDHRRRSGGRSGGRGDDEDDDDDDAGSDEQDGQDVSDKSNNSISTDDDNKEKEDSRLADDQRPLSFHSKSKKDTEAEKKYTAPDVDADTALISLEEHLQLMEARLVEDISAIVREELAEFKRLFLVSPPETPEPEEPAGEDFGEMFRSFAKIGDSKGNGDQITLSSSDRWWKQSKLIDGRTITTTDTAICFRKVAKTKRMLPIGDYLLFLEAISKSKKIPIEEIRFKLCNCGPPAILSRFQTGSSTQSKPDRQSGGYRRFDEK